MPIESPDPDTDLRIDETAAWLARRADTNEVAVFTTLDDAKDFIREKLVQDQQTPWRVAKIGYRIVTTFHNLDAVWVP